MENHDRSTSNCALEQEIGARGGGGWGNGMSSSDLPDAHA
jgi:hypothetical protein